jgi:AcrR family transcriptional regulator
VAAEPGLRERKKEQTRAAISAAAMRLFEGRGFDAVTVAQVAREAGVSEGTVFNYFPVKEDLFYEPMEAFESELVEAVRRRDRGESVSSAFQRFVLDRSRGLAEESRADVIAAAARIVAGSPALQARERQIVAHATEALADVIASGTRGGEARVEAWTVANALMGVQRALVEHVRASALAGRRGPALASTARAKARRAFALLDRGLDDYGRDARPL